MLYNLFLFRSFIFLEADRGCDILLLFLLLLFFSSLFCLLLFQFFSLRVDTRDFILNEWWKFVRQFFGVNYFGLFIFFKIWFKQRMLSYLVKSNPFLSIGLKHSFKQIFCLRVDIFFNFFFWFFDCFCIRKSFRLVCKLLLFLLNR